MNSTSKKTKTHSFHFKDPGSALTHLIFAGIALIATPALLIPAFYKSSIHGVSMTLFMLGVILLYSASSIYHTFDISENMNKRLRQIDHMMIYILIAGTYSPVCLIALNGKTGFSLLIVIWIIAMLGIFQALFWIHCPKWVSAVIYIAMGWLCMSAFSQIYRVLPTGAFIWLLAGGIIYTVGGIIYALKLPIFNNKHKNFGSHEIFHLFCIGGTLCHFILMIAYILWMPI